MLRLKAQNKYWLTCTNCGHVTPNFWTWFDQNQQCPKCASKHSEVSYNRRYQRLPRIIKRAHDSFWSYFPFLPLDRKSTRLNSSHVRISYAVFCLKKKT